VSIILLDSYGANALALPPPQGAGATSGSPQSTATFMGSDTCRVCHEDLFLSLEKTPHWKTTLDTRRGPAFQGCEACHGPGSEHVASGGDPANIFVFAGASASTVTGLCLKCHQYGEEHSNFERSAHSVNDVSCVDCHSAHHAAEPQMLLVKKQPDLCYSCHTDIKPQFDRPFHHRVNEGLVSCTDCHNQHGGFLSRQLRSTTAQNVACVGCHTDKAGPFVFEHAAVRIEGCVACHLPHGSSNPRLLTRSQVNVQCLECHTLTIDSSVPGAPSFHNQAQKYQACTVCHTQIHGSNADSAFFK
jgi:DmsE family decaheme c-type cytochrome